VRRITLFLTVAAIVAVMMSISASPAMAQTFFVGGSDFDHFDRDHFVGNIGPASQEFSIKGIRSGAANPTIDISNTGSNSNLAPTVQQSVNTGNVLNEQGAVLSGSEVDSLGDVVDGLGFFDGLVGFDGDIDFSGSSVDIAPSLTGGATQTIQQSAAV
jgi:hypothetical protein